MTARSFRVDPRLAALASAIATVFTAPHAAAAPGDPLGPLIVVQESGPPFSSYSSMARAADGRIVAVREEDGLKVRVYRRDGTPLSPVRSLPGAGDEPDVAMDDGGAGVVGVPTWASPSIRRATSL